MICYDTILRDIGGMNIHKISTNPSDLAVFRGMSGESPNECRCHSGPRDLESWFQVEMMPTMSYDSMIVVLFMGGSIFIPFLGGYP